MQGGRGSGAAGQGTAYKTVTVYGPSDKMRDLKLAAQKGPLFLMLRGAETAVSYRPVVTF